MHILFHLKEDICRFGSFIFYETGKGEQFNKFIRVALFRTNRQAMKSRDVAKRIAVKHTVTDGQWKVSEDHSATQNVIEVNKRFKVIIDKDGEFDGSNIEKDIKVYSSGVFRTSDGLMFVGKVKQINESKNHPRSITFEVFYYQLLNGP